MFCFSNIDSSNPYTELVQRMVLTREYLILATMAIIANRKYLVLASIANNSIAEHNTLNTLLEMVSR